MDVFDHLMRAGLTRHESMLYVTLCREGELTGYEAAKISGIPRSNAYLALAGLVEKGGANHIEGEAVKYCAVPVTEFVKNMRRQMNETLDFIEDNIPVRNETRDPYITITGSPNIINKMKNIIDQAADRIYLSMAPSELKCVLQEIEGARGRNLKVVIITSKPFKMEGVTIYYNEKQPGRIRLIADSSHVLTGEINEMGNSTCLYSKNKNLIELIKDSLTNEIKLIQIQNHTT